MKYIPTIGLELHCEMNTKSKVFSPARNEYNEIPNLNVKPLDMAFPGTLPVLNKEALRKAFRMALALNCQTPDILLFDRKNYYYPDLPKGYQITQMKNPVGINGYLDIDVNGCEERIFIHDIHLEEDTASQDHYDDYSLLDYNRSGVPLVEIVTEPCIHSAEAAVSYLETLRNTFKYCDISLADTKLGQIRCDVNVSLAPEKTNKLGTKVEMKNINSFANVAKAIDSEIKRQMDLIKQNKQAEIVQETRRYDEETNQTISMRSKVDAIDYKYFAEANIPKMTISTAYIEEIKKEIPVLPYYRFKKYTQEYQLTTKEANLLIKEKELADYFDKCIAIGINPKSAANWIIVNIITELNKEDIKISEFYLTPEFLKQIISKIDDNTISSKQAKEIFKKSIENHKEPREFMTNENTQLSNEEELKNIIETIVDNNQEQVQDYRNGHDNLFKYFVGQVMKETKGKANPVLTNQILKEYLDK